MAVWVNTAGSGSGLGPYVADMGVYTGPWPLRYPEVFDGFEPAWGDLLEFYLALENPAHPGDPLFVLDESYPAQVWDTYRYGVGALDTDWVWYGTGGAGAPVYGQEPPAGAHLWVVGTHFAGSGSSTRIVPPFPPEHYVPASLGGTAPESPWGWSAWQPGLTQDTTVPVSDGSNWTSTGAAHTHTDTAALIPPALDFNTALAETLTGATATRLPGTTGTAGAVLNVDASKTDPLPFGVATSQIHLMLQQLSYDYRPDYTLPSFDPPGVAGVDWGYPPFQPSPVAYELPGAADWTWGDWAFQAGGYLDNSSGNAPSSFAELLVIGWRADSIPAGAAELPLSGVHVMGDVPVSSGDLVHSIDFGPDHAYTLYVDGSPPPPTITLLVWAAVAATAVWGGGAGSNFSWPPNGEFGWHANFKPTPSTDADLPLQWTTHRWRYWTGPTLAWHTVGGHWSSSVTVQILTPGVGWVPIVDGPA